VLLGASFIGSRVRLKLGLDVAPDGWREILRGSRIGSDEREQKNEEAHDATPNSPASVAAWL
jgi:hypothetical protein